jgi:hypothetical protein
MWSRSKQVMLSGQRTARRDPDRRFPPPWSIEGLSSVHCKNAGGVEAKILVDLNK